MTFNDKKSNNADFSRLMINDSVVLDKPVIYTLLKDKDNGIWIGTTNGIYYLEDQNLRYYSVKDGLPDNVIYAILEDFQGNIWISTNKGLSRFDRKAETFTNYHQADGLSSEEYDLHAKFIDKNGILYFGGIDGITYFNPEKLPAVKPANKLYIDNIQITNIDENSVETVYLENNQRLSVKQKQFPVTINFSDINLKYYKNTTFAYRLLPDNTRWNMIKDKRFIQLMNLSPNDYTLEIQEVGKDNRLGDDRLLRIPITVVPLWWQSKFAYWAYVFLIMFVVYRIFRFSLKRKIEHQENLKLKELNNIKSRLYTNITHEFRTPLTVIKGMTGEMRYSLTYDEQKHCDDKLEMIERNSDKLLHLVKQMLDMSKIEEGKMKLDLIQDDIVSYLQYVLESFQSMADSRNIKLVFYHETDKVVMDYDQDKIFMIASNLLSNAIKFTPGGGKVIFHVKREQDKENDNLVIKVQDSGIGIEEEHLEHIFDRFYQVDNTSTRRGEGTGIGLALTKELVEMMKGEITVNSIPGERTEFRVTIPITNNAALQKAKPLKTKQTEPDNGTVDLVIEEEKENGLPLALIVEDNPDVAKYIISCLKGKYRVKWSPDGGQGIDTAINSIPDIIISDVMMPVKDGFEVCETLKQDERTSHIPIVMLTAKATDNDRIEGLSHGADAYLTKPFNKQELFVRLEQLIKIRKQLQEKYSRVEISITEKAEPSVEEKFLIKVIGIIEKNIDNSKLDSEMLAEGLSLSESQLYRKVKAVSGKSVSRFIREIRLSAAKKLIETTTLNISQIAYQCGFNDPAWFSRIFKKEFGESPGKFRKS
jgi:signal transduction histidine kinase/DNA-binding response OmpR family regulator